MLVFLTWLAFILAAISLTAAGFILFRHWSEIRLLDPDSIREELHKRKRKQIVRERFFRIQNHTAAPLKAMYKQGIYKAKTSFHRAYVNLIKLNRFYEQSRKPLLHVAPSQGERIKVLLDEARSLSRDLKWADAEKRYLEILLMDNRNPDAYKGIGLIYLKQKMFEQAKETFSYLVRAKQADDIVYASLAEIAEKEGDKKIEEAMRLKAVEVRPRLANRHADLAEFYAKSNDHAKAWPSAKRATDLDPKSARYQEVALECLIALNEFEEAKRRYDKLRLLLDDQARLQKWREKLDHVHQT